MSPELQSLDHSPRAAPARDQMLGCANKLQWRNNQTPKRQAFWGHTFMTSATFFISTRRRLQMCAVGLVAALVGCASGGGSAPDAALSQSESGIGQAISTLGGFLSPYRPDILQGNVTTKEQVAALKVGMSKEQVAGMLQSILKLKSLPKNLDATDGLAAAVCHFYNAGKITGGKNYTGWSAFVKQNPNKVS